ncbi:PAS domain S-box-containing protein [Luteibacter sp. OK325]|uniref:hybrid sensor histidine kinase/response regulator n=1 Tax=Luteibacter sp. OK325 TaxID=2135670 RepID=UPI000D3F13EE|nr:PAS domain-containing sensor histidine kinase [Luteibacter sp. OK325]PTR33932.1 PAS domain S-box-containing protein [Luteibacter sp. OK325]
MRADEDTGDKLPSREQLEERLREAEETLDAIRRGEVDAVVVHHPDGERIYTLESADRPYRVLVEHMQEGAVTLTSDGVILYCNRRFAALLGLTRESMIGRSVIPYLERADARVMTELLSGGADAGAGRAAEVTLHRTDGHAIPVTLSAVDLPFEADLPRIICIIATDLTHARQRSHELAATNEQLAAEMVERRSAEDRLAVALDAAGMGSWDIDLEQGSVTISRQAEVILGLAEAGSAARTPDSLLHPFLAHEQAEVKAAFDLAMTTGVLDFERRVRSPSEESARRWVHVIGRTYHRDGLPARLVGVVADVTERRLMETQLRQAQKMEAVGQLTGGIAHDFNNLLMVIGGSLDVLESSIPGENARAQRFFAAAKSGVERGASLNQQLLAFSRRQDLQAQPVCVDDLLRAFATLLSRALGETVSLELPQPAQRWYCRSDPHQLETAILNLAINARDAMPHGGRLTIMTALTTLTPREALAVDAEAGSYVVVRVRDSGTGMTPETAARIFDPFFTTKAMGKGTGLGLSQVYGFVRQSGGFVNVTSEMGQGTTIDLCLPYTDEVAAASPVTQAPTAAGDGRVLVVDDDINVREVSVAMLSALGYTTVEAGDAVEALGILAQRSDIHVIFSDVIMPGEINGLDLARYVRANYANVAVVLASGYTAQQRDDKGTPSDVELLRKPYSRAALAAALTRARAAQA